MKNNLKKDFPIFQNNSWIVFLDNGASVQKPSIVIDGVKDYLENSYANIHRWYYSLSEKSEEYFHESKEETAKMIGCYENEIIYTYNATYAFNLIAQTLVQSQKLQKWDTVLVGIWEHHSNIVPRQILAETFWFSVKFINIDQQHKINWADFKEKYDDTVKVVSCSHVSNVSWKIYDIKKIKAKLRSDTFFIVDGSQAIPHFQVNLSEIGCDAYIFTWHKMMANTWIGILFLKRERIKSLNPMMWWWWTIKNVTTKGCELAKDNEKFELGTPNLTWAVSLLKAREYIKKIGYKNIWQHEQELVSYTLEKFEKISDKVTLIWPKEAKERVGAFSFVIPSLKNFNVVGEKFAEQNICVRCGWHCAYPLHYTLDVPWTCRMSLYIYNTHSDIDKFFEVLKSFVS